MDNLVEEVLDFIRRRWFDTDANWTSGNCLWFAYILKKRFPKLKIYYFPIEGHFTAGIDNKYFDATGLYIPKEEAIDFKELKKQEPNYYRNLLKDCYR